MRILAAAFFLKICRDIMFQTMNFFNHVMSIRDLIIFFYLEPDIFHESYSRVFLLRDCFVSETSRGNSKVSLVEGWAGLFGAIGDVSPQKSGRARQVSVFLREPLFTLRYAEVRIHFAARNRRSEICEMKEAVGPRPSPLPVAAVWTISNGSYCSDLIYRLPPISVP